MRVVNLNGEVKLIAFVTWTVIKTKNPDQSQHNYIFEIEKFCAHHLLFSIDPVANGIITSDLNFDAVSDGMYDEKRNRMKIECASVHVFLGASMFHANTKSRAIK